MGARTGRVARRCSGGAVGLAALASLSLAGCDLGEAPVTYAVPGARLSAADVDGDGDVDLISGGGDTFATLLNDGTGSYTTVPNDEHADFTKMVVLDVDLDGRQDLVMLAYFPGEPPTVPESWHVLTRLSNGDGTFGEATVVAETGVVPGDQASIAVTTGDVDADGRPDLVLYKAGPGVVGSAEVFRGTGPNAFAPPVASPSTSPVHTHGQLDARAARTADVTGDGHLDLVVAGTGPWPGDPFGRGQIAVLAGDGTGAFPSSASYATPEGASNRAIGPAVGDFDEDGRPDVAVADTRIDGGPETLTFWFGTPAGTLGDPVTRAGKGEHDAELVAGDVDGDGHLDLVTAACLFATETEGAGWFMAGDGDGSIAATTQLNAKVPQDQERGGVVVADLDGDARLDVAIADGAGTLTVFRNRLTP